MTAQASIADAERPSAPPAPSVAKSETKPLVPHAVEGSGTAVFRPGTGLDLAAWLAETHTDDRQSVTAIVRFPADGRAAALDRAETLMTALDAAGARARLVVEPAREAESLVVIGYEGAP